MCGLAGWIRAATLTNPEAEALARALTESIARRGPDGQGLLLVPDHGIGLVHARLAIIDIGHRSNQPLVDRGTNASIIYNGEVYNYRALRAHLQASGVQFDTESDTEVLLRGYLTQGEEFFRRVRGMYALVIHDPRSGELLALRDPLGIKPLYVRRDADGILFGSSARGLASIGGGGTERDPAAAVSLALLGCVLEPLTAFRAVQMARPGILYRWRLARGRVEERTRRIEPELPWAQPMPRRGDVLEAALAESVGAHFESDVPAAVFQSAGLDSRLTTALAVRAGLRPHLLTLSFEEFRGTHLDEAPAAAIFAKSMNLDHTSIYLDFKAFQDLRGDFLRDMESPTIDGINTYLIAKLCREAGFKVALSGLGADELFAGYRSFQRLPLGARAGVILRSAAVKRLANRVAQRLGRNPNRSPKAAYLPEYMGDIRQLYLFQRSIFLPQDVLLALRPDVCEAGFQRFLDAFGQLTAGDLAPSERAVRRFERDVYMRNMLLKDADWAGMAHGVEVRTPFADGDLFRTLCDADAGCAYGKSDLRRLLARVTGLAEEPKQKVGFSVPYQLWFASSAGERAPAHGIRGWCRQVIEANFPGWGAGGEMIGDANLGL